MGKKITTGQVAIVVSQFNEEITTRLLNGCCDELKKSGIKESMMTIVEVPGAFEIPVAALALARRKNISAVICLGAVIRGQTDHYRLVAEQAARGIMDVALITGKPVIFEVLACETVKLANERSQEKGDNKGRDAAQAALHMIHVLNINK